MLGLRYSEDWRTILWMVMYFAASIHLWRNMYELSWGVFFLNWGFCIAFSFFMATIVHNCVHVPIFHDHTLNSLFQVALSLCMGWPMSTLVPGHNLSHHKHTQGPKDAMRTYKMRYSHNLVNYLMFPIECTKRIGRYDIEYMIEQMKEGRPIFKQYVLECIVYYPLQVVLAYLDWRRYIIVWLIPQLYAKFQIIGINSLQHDGCTTPEEHKYNHSRNFTGWFINFMTFNNGFHTIHHLFPGMHWTKLPFEHEKQVVPNIHPNLNKDNIFTYFWDVHVMNNRRWYDGTPMNKLPPDVPDEPWYDGTSETYSDKAYGLYDAPSSPTTPAAANTNNGKEEKKSK